MQQRPLQATYLYALSQLDGIGNRALQRIAQAFPSAAEVVEASEETLAHRLDPKLARTLCESMRQGWSTAWAAAEDLMARQDAQGIVTLSLNDERYPPLLRLTDDPPVLLYVRGSTAALQQLDTVAVVGTREATPRGSKVAHRVADRFASRNFVIVSGLAQGIDTAGHLGALEQHGITIAVLATGLDTIYPAENADLAHSICAEGGALVSEHPVGAPSFRAAFVRRDRIQAGLSLGVIVVQTGITGGTMHTVRYAEQYGRTILCPQPLDDEASAPQYGGIWELLNTGRAGSFHNGEYDDIVRNLSSLKHRLLSLMPPALLEKAQEEPPSSQRAHSVDTTRALPHQETLWGSDGET